MSYGESGGQYTGPSGWTSLTLVGTLGRDIEVKQIPTGSWVAEFSIAQTYVGRGKERVTQWFRCTYFGRQDDGSDLTGMASRYGKGKKMAVQGQLQARPYEKDGVPGLSLDVRVQSILPIAQGGGEEGEEGAAPNGFSREPLAPATTPASRW